MPVCAVHIHVGASCVSNAGGHYYTGTVTTDPWTSIVYTSDANGKSTGSVSVNTGALSSEVKGRAMIIHGHGGGRIACAILSDGVSSALHASSFVKYYNYNGALAVSGNVGPMTTASETTQAFKYSLSGVDPACSSGPDTSKANSCGSESHGLDVAPSDALVACIALCLLALSALTLTRCPARWSCAQSTSTRA